MLKMSATVQDNIFTHVFETEGAAMRVKTFMRINPAEPDGESVFGGVDWGASVSPDKFLEAVETAVKNGTLQRFRLEYARRRN